MRELINITTEAHQEHLITLEDDEITFTLRFLSVVQAWFIDVEYKDKSIHGVKLSLGVFHMVSKNFPFDFFVTDNSKLGIDPYKIDDFDAERCSIYILDPEDMEQVRGVAVEF